jgi:hypothetical protein
VKIELELPTLESREPLTGGGNLYVGRPSAPVGIAHPKSADTSKASCISIKARNGFRCAKKPKGYP